MPKGKRISNKKSQITSCESCENYEYDEDLGYYVCDAALDEDDMARFLQSQEFDCPYYRMNDEYRIVRKQI